MRVKFNLPQRNGYNFQSAPAPSSIYKNAYEKHFSLYNSIASQGQLPLELCKSVCAFCCAKNQFKIISAISVNATARSTQLFR